MEFIAGKDHPVVIPCENVDLEAVLHLPPHAKGLVVFVHGSGSSRLSPRNQLVAKLLQQEKLATVLFDLLTAEEDEIDTKTLQYRFNIEFLANRLLIVTKWLLQNPAFHKLPLGYFGASTGGGAALVAAADEKNAVQAVVSRGGRPDLAGPFLDKVRASTLLIVGGLDTVVIELNEAAYQQLNCEKQLAIVPGATHLFEEPGKLEDVAHLASNWFSLYLK